MVWTSVLKYYGLDIPCLVAADISNGESNLQRSISCADAAFLELRLGVDEVVQLAWHHSGNGTSRICGVVGEMAFNKCVYCCSINRIRHAEVEVVGLNTLRDSEMRTKRVKVNKVYVRKSCSGVVVPVGKRLCFLCLPMQVVSDDTV